MKATLSAVNRFVRGNGSLTFTIDGICDDLTESKSLPVGRPGAITGSMSGPANVASYQVHKYSVPAQSLNDGHIVWTYPSDWTLRSSGTSPNVYAFYYIGTQSGYVQVWKNNSCGNGGAKWKYVTVTSGGGGCPECPVIIEMASNPLDNQLAIRYGDRATQTPLAAASFDRPVRYVIRDTQGNVVLSHASDLTALTIDVSRIQRKGIYVLTVIHPGKGQQQYRLVRN